MIARLTSLSRYSDLIAMLAALLLMLVALARAPHVPVSIDGRAEGAPICQTGILCKTIPVQEA